MFTIIYRDPRNGSVEVSESSEFALEFWAPTDTISGKRHWVMVYGDDINERQQDHGSAEIINSAGIVVWRCNVEEMVNQAVTEYEPPVSYMVKRAK
jgi:hypothetical protein